MKKTYFITPLFFALVLHSALAQTPKPAPSPALPIENDPANWKQFTTAEGGFTISMPGVPTNAAIPVETEVGKIVMHANILNTRSGEYGASYADFPVRSDDPIVIRRLLDGGRDQVLQGSKLLNENEVNFEGIVGRELLLDKDGLIARHRMLFVKGRLYVVILATSPAVAFKSGVASSNPGDRTDFYEMICSKFFGSFKIIPHNSSGQSADEARAANNGILAPVIVKNDIYPADADANKEIGDALKEALTDHKRVMLVFGANWCYDCHVLDRALHEGPAGEIVKEGFILVHIDIGEGNKNLDLLKKYKVPLDKGVPAVAILGEDGRLLYSSGEGEFEAARRMMKKDLLDFLQKWKEQK
jgi:hypothetical protein